MLPTHPPSRQGLSLRLLLPSTRHSLPVWEISLDGRVIGTVEQLNVGRSTKAFYRAIGIHNQTGERVSLELSTDYDERVEAVHRFWLDPLSCAQHLPWSLRRHQGLD